MVKSLYSPAQLAEVRNCQQCAAPLVRQSGESPSAFMARTFCDRACSNRWKNARLKGKPNPNLAGERNGMYGRRHTDAAKEIQRQAAKAHPLSAEKQRENALKRIGTRRPQSTRDRMSNTRRQWWENATQEQREQHRQKVTSSGQSLRLWHSDRMRAWYINATPEQLERRRAKLRDKASNPSAELRRRMSEGQKERWASADPETRARWVRTFRRIHWRHLRNGPMTSIERAIGLEMDRLGIRHNWNVPVLRRWMVDFLLVDAPVIIECDGDYWHSLPQVRERDERKNNDFARAGFTVLRFSETAINTDLAGCVQRIVDALRELGAASVG